MSEYWKLYDDLINIIEDDNIREGLKNAQTYVNGLTDGWYDFHSEFEKTIRNNESKLSTRQLELSKFLLTDILNALENR